MIKGKFSPELDRNRGSGLLNGGRSRNARGMAEVGLSEPVREHVPSYQDWARSNRGSGWIYLAGTGIILGIWIAASVFIVLLAMIVSILMGYGDAQRFGPSWLNNLVDLSTFLPFCFATPFVIAILHGRPWRTIITPFRRIRIRMIAVGAGIWAALLVLSMVISIPFTTQWPRWNFDAGLFFANLAVAVVFLFFQTTAEELFFRGYLGSWISLRLKNVWLQSLIIGLIFMVPHLGNPEVVSLRGWDLVLMASTYFSVGFGFMFVSRMTGSIELAIGAHFVNNFLVMVIVGGEDSTLGGGSLWVSDADFSALDAVTTWLTVAVFIAVAFRIRGKGEVVPVMPPARKSVQLPRPGWYPDPWRQATYRYWNGHYWTPWSCTPPPVPYYPYHYR